MNGFLAKEPEATAQYNVRAERSHLLANRREQGLELAVLINSRTCLEKKGVIFRREN